MFGLRTFTVEVAAVATALLSYTLFSGPLRGFALFAAAKLVLRQGTRALPRALALVMLPAFFGCLLVSEAARIAATAAVGVMGGKNSITSILRSSARALELLGDPDRTISDLTGRALQSTSSPTSVWRACIPRGAHARASVAVRAACAARRWLLVAAVVSAIVPFLSGSPTALVTRAVATWWILSSPASHAIRGKSSAHRSQ